MSRQPVEEVGPLVLLGGAQWQLGPGLAEGLLERSGGDVLLIPTAAAYERPERCIEAVAERLGALGAVVEAAMVLGRADAEDPTLAEQVRAASFLYVADGSPLHLRAVLKDSAVLRAMVAAWQAGAVVLGASAGAMALSDPMVDPRGGAFTVGLGLVHDVAVVPHYTGELSAQLKRTVALTPSTCCLVALGEQTALVRASDGTWSIEGGGEVAVYAKRELADLAELAGKSIW